MIVLILIGLLSGLFFSSTFIFRKYPLRKKHGVFKMRFLLVIIILFPVNVLAVDNTMVHKSIKEIVLQDEPVVGMSFMPGTEPGVVISLPEGKPPVIPGYRVRFKGVPYIVGISCRDNLQDDCSDYVYAEDYKNRSVYIRYIQTSASGFKTPEGAAIGDRWDKTVERVGADEVKYTANDSCVLLPSEWNACIDLMSARRKFDPNVRRLMPAKSSKIDFFFKENQGD